jgi:hypothetical protein
MHMQRIRYSSLPHLLFLSTALVLMTVDQASAQRSRGGGHQSISRGGGGGQRAAPSRAASSNRATAPNRSAAGNRPSADNRAAAQNRTAGANRSVDRTNSTNRNTNVNRGSNNNINIDNDINVDVDNGWGGGDWDYHPIAAGVAFGTAAAITSAAIGSMYYSLPPACAPRPYGGMSYYYCDNVWYQPQYAGTSVTYTVVNPPY